MPPLFFLKGSVYFILMLLFYFQKCRYRINSYDPWNSIKLQNKIAPRYLYPSAIYLITPVNYLYTGAPSINP